MNSINFKPAATLREATELVAHGLAPVEDLADLTKVAARYAVAVVGREHAAADGDYTVFGRHCETDRLVAQVPLPAPQAGDLLAMADTGAYTYSMASNYNRFPRPAVVMVNNGRARLIARREPLEHVLDLDVD